MGLAAVFPVISGKKALKHAVLVQELLKLTVLPVQGTSGVMTSVLNASISPTLTHPTPMQPFKAHAPA